MSYYRNHLPIAGASGQSTGFNVDQSIRFNDSDNPRMGRTPSSTGTEETWTWSFWIKRAQIGTLQVIFQIGADKNNCDQFFFNTSDQLQYEHLDSGSDTDDLNTTQVFRDTSAWYHIVLNADTTNSVTSERIRIYVNGERVTDFATENYPTQNTPTDVNTQVLHQIGAQLSATYYSFDGYMSEIHLIDGYAYGPEYFGEFKENTDIWIPKEYTGSYGTNGFKIDGRDSSDLGDDESGQGNDFTTSGLAAHDQVLDSPTNNFCTINPTYRGSSSTSGHYGVVSNGNLFIEHDSNNDGGQLCTQLIKTGKWYWEVYIKAGGNNSSYQLGSGIAAVNNGYYKQDGRNEGARAGEIGFNSYTGVVKFANSDTKTYSEAPFSDTDIIQIAADFDNGAIYYGKNGTFMGSGDPTSGASKTNAGATWSTSTYNGGWVPTTYVGGGGVPEIFINFGQEGTFGGNVSSGGNSDGNGIGNFKYSVPSGYLSICTKNLGS